jgi:hypothetical protein
MRTALRHVALCQQTSRALLQAGPAGKRRGSGIGRVHSQTSRQKNQNDDGGDNPDDDSGGKRWREAASGHFRA